MRPRAHTDLDGAIDRTGQSREQLSASSGPSNGRKVWLWRRSKSMPPKTLQIYTAVLRVREEHVAIEGAAVDTIFQPLSN